MMSDKDELIDGDLGTTDDFELSRVHGMSYSTMDKNPVDDRESEETFTIDKAVDQLGFGKFQLMVAAIAGFVWTADAMEQMVLSILSPALECDWGLQKWQQSMITSLVFVGMTFGAVFWGWISDRYGRKIVMILSAVTCMYYGVLSALSPSLVWLLIFRGLVGFGVAGGSQAVVIYSEFLPTTYRAKSIVAIEVFFATGALFEAALAYFVMPIMGWRWLLIYSSIPLLLFIASCKWLPESMRYNLAKGHIQGAEKTLSDCAKMNGKPLPLGRLVAPSVQEPRGRISDLFNAELRVTTLLLLWIWFANTFCYYGVVLLTTELLKFDDAKGGEEVCDIISSGHVPHTFCSLDCTPLTPKTYLEVLWTTAAEFPGLIITFFIIDVLGRKKSSFLLFVLFAVSAGLVAVCKGSIFMIICLFCARCFIAGAWQVMFVYAPEVYPTKCRAVGIGVCSSVARVGAIVTPFVAQVLIEKSIYATIGIYAGIGATAAIASMLLPIETKGRDLADSVNVTR